MRRLSSAVTAIVLALMVLAIWPGLDLPGRTVRAALLFVAGPALVGLAVLRPCYRPSRWLAGGLAVAAVAGILGIFFASAPETASVSRDLGFLLSGWFVALAAALTCEPHGKGEDPAWLGFSVVLSLAALGLIAMAQLWAGWQGLPQVAPPGGTFVNRNVAAQVLVVLIPLAVGATVGARGRLLRWSCAATVGVGLAYVVATRSRGAWLGLVAAFAVGLAVSAPALRGQSARSLRGLLGLVVLAVVIGATSWFAPAGDDPAKSSVGETLRTLANPVEGTGQFRLAFWRNGLAMLEDTPGIGVGPGRFAVVYPLYQRARVPTPRFGTWFQVEHAHNDAIEFATELGLPAALVLIGLLVGALILSGREALRARSLADVAEPAARAAALAGVLIHGLVSFPLHSPASSFLAWLLVGRAWGAGASRLDSRAARGAIFALMLFFAAVGGWVGTREIRAKGALREALGAHAARDCEGALEAADRSRRAAPWGRRVVGMSAMLRFECDRDAERSLEALEPALARQPHNLNLLLAVGARRLKAGRADDAERAFRHTLEISPDLERGWLGLAMSLDANGRREEAARACAEAVRLAPGLDAARAFCIGNGYVAR